jgi:hypothetical protein
MVVIGIGGLLLVGTLLAFDQHYFFSPTAIFRLYNMYIFMCIEKK